ncbi:MAG: hypothetical protein KJN99_13805 [Marinicaulis sp.]|nr:hypothetical protein [Marinicaulis sp.]
MIQLAIASRIFEKARRATRDVRQLFAVRGSPFADLNANGGSAAASANKLAEMILNTANRTAPANINGKHTKPKVIVTGKSRFKKSF